MEDAAAETPRQRKPNMTFFKTLFARKESSQKLTRGFRDHVEKAINLLADTNSNLDNGQFMELLVDNGINKYEATEIFLFLPIAFVRLWLTDVKWFDTYIEYFSEQKQVERKFSETPSYKVISDVAKHYFQNSPSRNTVLKIAGRSAEFHAINKLLLDNPDSKLKEIEFSPTVIIR